MQCRGLCSKSGVWQPPIRMFMDDLTITITSVPGTRWILQGLGNLISWARMSFKPSKSRSLVLKKGQMMDKFCFSLSGITIPSVSEQPVKSFRKIFDSSLKESASIKRTIKDFDKWFSKVDKSGLTGRFKACIYQHTTLSGILWPLLVLRGPYDNSRVPGEENQHLPSKMAWFSLQSKQHGSVWQKQHPASSSEQPY